MDENKRSTAALDELEKLISLAESVSENISNLDSKLYKLKVQTLAVMSLSYLIIALGFLLYIKQFLSYPIMITFSIGFIALIIVGGLYVLHNFKIIKDTKYELKSESIVITKLIDMIHSYKMTVPTYRNDMLSSAVIEMRLGRIKFAAKNFSKRFADDDLAREINH